MQIFAYISLMASWISLLLGSYIFGKNSKATVNRLFLLFSIGIASCAYTEFAMIQSETIEMASIWVNLNNNICWPLTLALLLHLVLVFVEEDTLLKKKLLYPLIYLPGVLVIAISQLTDLSVAKPVYEWYGWRTGIPDKPVLAYLVAIWTLLVVLLSVFFCARYYLIQKNIMLKQQAKFVLLGLSFCVLISLLTGILIPLLGITIPGMTISSFAFSSGLIVYAIVKYQLLSLTPKAATEDVIETMSDLFFLVNLDGKIKQINQMTLDVLGYEESEILGQSMANFFVEKSVTSWILNVTELEASNSPPIIHDVETTLRTETGQTLSISLSNSLIHDSEGNLRGVVFLARDITERKQAAEELHKLNQFLEGIIDNANVWLNVLDEHANVVIWNKAAEAISGYSREEVVGHGKIWEWQYPDEIARADALATTAAIIEGKQVDVDAQTTIRCKDGQLKIISWYSRNIVDARGTPIGAISIGRDITEWKQAEAELQKTYLELEARVEERTAALQREVSERKEAEKDVHKLSQFFERIIDNASMWLNVLDERTNVVIWNKASELISGYSREEVIGHDKIWEWLYPDETYCNEVLTGAINIIEGTQEDTDTETTIRCKDGQLKTIAWYSRILTDEKNNSIGSIAIGRDITDWKRVENALRESEARYRSLFENAPISLWEQDFSEVKRYLDQLQNNGVNDFQTYFEQHPEAVLQCIEKVKVLDVNTTTLAVYHASNKGELFEGLSSKIFTPESYKQYRAGLVALLEGNTVFETESTRKTLKGDTIHITSKWSLPPGFEDTWAKVFVSVIDITARKRAEEAHHDLQERKADFIAMTSHELRTPLTVIRGYVEILEHRLDELDQAHRKQCFEILNRNVHRLERLISGVSTLGQIERGVFHLNLMKIDFCHLLNEALMSYQTFLGPQLEVQGVPEEISVFTDGDTDRLLQILDNLLENAVKQTSQDQRRILVSLELQPDVIYLRVVDNGVGIAPEDLNRIFMPFTSIPTEFSVGGTGIGLYVSRMIAEAHGGTLTVQSEGKGYGTTFILELPRKRDTLEA